MEKLDIKVKRNKKGDLLDGPFYIKELDFDEFGALQEKHSADPIFNSEIVRACLVDSEGKNIFKPQQVPLIKSRINGAHFGVILYVANKANDFGAIAKYMDMYEKNLSSDQNSD